MDVRVLGFGRIEIDGRTYDRDVVVDRGRVGKRHKKASKPLRDRYGHTPLSLLEPIPWDCRRLIVGTGADGALPIEPDVVAEARRRGVDWSRCRPRRRARSWPRPTSGRRTRSCTSPADGDRERYPTVPTVRSGPPTSAEVAAARRTPRSTPIARSAASPRTVGSMPHIPQATPGRPERGCRPHDGPGRPAPAQDERRQVLGDPGRDRRRRVVRHVRADRQAVCAPLARRSASRAPRRRPASRGSATAGLTASGTIRAPGSATRRTGAGPRASARTGAHRGRS